jgi:DNA gyrase subunit A
VLKRDAVAKVVLNNLYKHTQLQTTFGANMLALVDGVPRTLPLSAFIRYWVEHQMDVIRRRTAFRLRKAEEEAHILRGLLKALDRLDEVIALIRGSATVEVARDGLIQLLGIDELQAQAILNMQLRRLAALERQKLIDRHDELQAMIDEFNAILASPLRQRTIISEELAEIVAKYGDDRRSKIVPFDGDMSMEDLIPQEDVVVTITRGGYAKRTKVDLYRSQHRGGKGVKGANLRGDDIVEHFFITTTHHWLLFFTNLGRVYRAKAYELPEAGRDSKGQHVANLLAFQPGEQIAAVLDLRDYVTDPYLVLATRDGLVKKTRLSEYDSNRSGGLIAVKLREGDELVGVSVASAEDDLLLVSVKGQSARFTADDVTLRPISRSTSGVSGMKFKPGDHLLSMSVIVNGSDPDVFVVFENGLAKRTLASAYAAKGRGIYGVRVAQVSDRGGDLVGALTVDEEDEVMVVMEKGKIVRARVDEVRRTGRNTMGVQFAAPDKRDSIVAVARNADRGIEVVLEGVLGDDSGATTTDNAPALAGSESESATVAGSVAFELDPDDSVDGLHDDNLDDNADDNADDDGGTE